eukprot:7719453-Alexandrium_andersonii.AAC.1
MREARAARRAAVSPEAVRPARRPRALAELLRGPAGLLAMWARPGRLRPRALRRVVRGRLLAEGRRAPSGLRARPCRRLRWPTMTTTSPG